MSRKHHILLLTLGIAVCGLILLFLVMGGLRIYCPVQLLTGLNCPGCGNTRAVMALFRLDIGAMLHYNLLFPLQMLYILRLYLICAKRYIREGRFAYHTRPDILDIAFLVLLLLWTIIRNCTPLH